MRLKGAVTAAQIVRELDKRGYKVKLFLAGTGDQSDLVKRIGGENNLAGGFAPERFSRSVECQRCISIPL